jgi:hypothetical protein
VRHIVKSIKRQKRYKRSSRINAGETLHKEATVIGGGKPGHPT